MWIGQIAHYDRVQRQDGVGEVVRLRSTCFQSTPGSTLKCRSFLTCKIDPSQAPSVCLLRASEKSSGLTANYPSLALSLFLYRSPDCVYEDVSQVPGEGHTD